MHPRRGQLEPRQLTDGFFGKQIRVQAERLPEFHERAFHLEHAFAYPTRRRAMCCFELRVARVVVQEQLLRQIAEVAAGHSGAHRRDFERA
jgi:hypothetical protein